jgi:hypothetical protein
LDNHSTIYFPYRSIEIALEETLDAKNTARHVIEALPARVTMDDVIHALYVASKFDRGEREIRAGKGVSDEEARKRLSKWQKR